MNVVAFLVSPRAAFAAAAERPPPLAKTAVVAMLLGLIPPLCAFLGADNFGVAAGGGRADSGVGRIGGGGVGGVLSFFAGRLCFRRAVDAVDGAHLRRPPRFGIARRLARRRRRAR